MTITEYGRDHVVEIPPGVRLRDVLEEEVIPYSLPCGGEGSCGRCRVRFLSGAPEATMADKEHLTGDELNRGIRLLCRSVLSDDCHVLLDKRAVDEGMEIESIGGASGSSFSGAYNYGIAVDLGTTTIAAALIRVPEGKSTSFEIVRTASCVNSQRSFGTDVISRISAADDEEVLARLSSQASSDISKLIKELIKADGNAHPSAITITGNTTMLHLLMGREVSGLGKYPYTPVSLEMERMDADFLFGSFEDTKLTILPGISAFVGADIVAGISTLDIKAGEKFFFLDLGTNGEMAFFDGRNIRVASAAAGPVFEAGGISCGTASIPGAICHVEIDKDTNKAKTETIGGTEPIGICGTGVLETVSELLSAGLMDETGLLCDDYFEEGYPLTPDGAIRLTQQDIRNVQLAKAAILTGARALLQDDVPERVYVSGGFGSHIIPEKIANLGMFPEAFDGKIETVGNSALKGAAMYTASVLSGWDEEADAIGRLGKIIAAARVVELSAADSFDEDYIEAMNF